MRTSSVLQAGYQLQEYAIDPVGDAALVPLEVPGMLLALVEKKVLQVIGTDGVAGQLQVPVPQGLQHAQTATTTATWRKG